MPQQKRIAFLDYKLDNFHANTFLKDFRTTLKDRGYNVTGCHALEESEGREWSKKNDVPYFATPQDLNDHADYYCILAPSNPETHLNLARLVLPFAKPAYIDKTFAPDLKTAQQIFPSPTSITPQFKRPPPCATPTSRTTSPNPDAKTSNTSPLGAAAPPSPNTPSTPSSWP